MASTEPSPYESEKFDIPPHPSLPRSPTTPSPSLVPSPTDILIVSIYPITLIAGSVFSIFSPSPASTSSYFSQKRNIFNIFFVKYGWLWTTLVFLIHTSRLRSSSRVKAFLRYAVATVWWISVTQWFFGPPIMDRTFLVTGGACQMVGDNPVLAEEEMGTARMIFTSAACKVAGGKWSGGHDLSGHVFLLTHASLFLWSEVLPVLSFSGVAGWESAGVLAILALWWWMLLMTGVYFHTWREKTTGWIAAIAQWAVLYAWALRSNLVVRSVVGIPGI